MNDAEWWVPPRPILWILGALFVGNVVTTAIPSLGGALALHAPLWSQPLNLPRVATFSLVHGGTLHWAFSSAWILLAALVLKGRLDERWMVGALVAGAVAGALAFGWSASDGVMVGSTAAGWALAWAAVGAFTRDPGRFGGWRRAYVTLLPLFVVALAAGGLFPPVGVFAAGAVGVLIGREAMTRIRESSAGLALARGNR